MKKLKNYNLIKTDDGSLTMFSKEFDETCHSLSGASNETRLHYIEGCKINEKSQNLSPLNVFEVGFGTGLGFELTSKELKGKCFLNFISTEIDQDLVLYFFEKNNLPFTHSKKTNTFETITNHFRLIILVGNARETIEILPDVFTKKMHAIYQDAFSPKRNAQLWTTQWFRQLKKISDQSCLMSTYSSSSSIRKSMIDAGWILYNGAQFGKKRTSTRAKLTGKTPDDILERLKASPVGSITDENYKSYTLENNR